MKLLIDECVDERLRHLFSGHDCHTTRHAGLTGLKNGLLLDGAEAAGFDALIAVDRNIPEQQNLGGRKPSILILCGPTNRLRDLAPLVPAAIGVLAILGPLTNFPVSPHIIPNCGRPLLATSQVHYEQAARPLLWRWCQFDMSDD